MPKFSTVRYKDWTPKFGVAYDLFGDGRTALKGNVGRYVLGQALVFGLSAQPGYNLQLTSSRAWVDNKNFVPDCDLSNPAAQGPTQTGGNFQIDTCNAPAGVNANFYDNQLRPNLAVQPDARYGWGKRPHSWESSVSAQHELNRNVSQRRRVLAVVRQLPRDRQHVGDGQRLHAVFHYAVVDPDGAGFGGRGDVAGGDLHVRFLQHQS